MHPPTAIANVPRTRVTRLLLTLATVAASAVAADAQETITVQPAGKSSLAQMMQWEAFAPALPAAPRVIPEHKMPPPREIGGAGAVPAPLAAPLVPAPPEPPGGGPDPFGPFLGTTFQALPDGVTSIPPDTMGAVGPSHVMTMLNTQVRIQNKSGGITSTVSLSTFWTSGTGLTGGPFDPKLVYDSIHSRWIATVDADADSTTSEVWFAISDGTDPTLGWTFYTFDADASNVDWADYPGFGVNTTWIAITNNMFPVGGGPFDGAKMWVIDKSTALAGGPLTVTVFPNFFDFEGGFGTYGAALQPAVTFGAEATLYILDNGGFSSGGIPLVRISRITGTGPAPVWSVQPGSSFAGTGLFSVANDFEFGQVKAPQLGVSATCDGGTNNSLACSSDADCPPGLPTSSCRLILTNDFRMLNAVFRNSRLWGTHTGGLPNGGPVNRTAAFWYQLNPAAMPAPIVQSGVVDGGAGVHHSFPSIAVNSADHVVLGLSRAHAGIFIEGAYTGRFASDGLGAMDPVSTLKAGEDSYLKDFGSKQIRWGDYSATVIDPTDDITFWSIQEYAAFDVGLSPDDDRWGTWWGRFTTTAEPTPSPTATPTQTFTPTPTCAAAPIAGCRTPSVGQKALLLIKDKSPDDKDLVIWKWIKGSVTSKAEFGAPLTATSYQLCIYNAAPSLILSAQAPAGGFCDPSNPTKPCWSEKTTGYNYKDKEFTPDGIQKLILREGLVPGKAKIILKGKGTLLDDPAIPLATSAVTVQLSAGSTCWEAVYTAPFLKDTAGPPPQFKDKAD